MTRRPGVVRRLLAGAAAGTVLVLSAAAGAQAADGDIVNVDRTAEGLDVSVDVPADVEVDLTGVSATVEGVDYPSEAFRLSDGDSRVTRTTILAIDTSDSMQGDRFESAISAARTFVEIVPPDVQIGIVGFSGTVDTALEPTTDREAAFSVLDGLELSRGTELYDAVLASVALAGEEGQGSVLLLSDGADTGSTSLPTVLAGLADSDVTINVVALEQGPKAVDILRQIAGDRGQAISADSEDLADTFSAEADVLARQIGVSIEVPTEVAAGQVSLQVTLPSTGGDVVATSTLLPSSAGTTEAADPVLSVPVETARTSSVTLPDWAVYAGIGVFGLGLAVALAMMVPAKPAPMSTEDRVSTYTSGLAGTRSGGAATATRTSPEATLTQASEAVGSLLKRNRGLEEKIAQRLAAAGSELKSSEWLLVHAAAFVIITLVGLLIGRGNLVVGIIFMVVGAVVPWIYLGFRASQRRKKFDSLLPETLQLMSGSLSVGLSLMQSVDTIVREGGEPVKSEFKRVLVETRLGVSLENALSGVADRFDSRDFRWVVMAIKIQRQVGGNLAELLNTVADTMREREYIRRQVGALSAEGKLSAGVLGALPPLFLLYLVVAQGDYVAPLFNDIRGIIMISAAALWLGVGVFWMSKLVKVEV
ncbi:MAG: type II secretion system F family protein [Nocardioides sp.]|uniref:type II secretion system F family protein n=1 Tax=Nocardioides sp. TaxID=35761 RepID=UPI002393AE90|nr:type II secretion system F family protein [Nocardioides sp.]MDE0775049.1 type II secretion system F family protein [Nocardioides sp.]